MRLSVEKWMRDRFELSRNTSGTNLLCMEGMRGFAVFLVFITHFCSLITPGIAGFPAISMFAVGMHAIGNAGVDFFFVLSGYLIYKTLVSRDQAFSQFMVRRMQRIYPAFVAVFTVYCALSLVVPEENKFPHDEPVAYLIKNLLLLPGVFPIKPMITVAWSLSYEMFFYLVLPVAIAGLQLRRFSSKQRIAGVAVAAVLFAAWSSINDGFHIRMLMFLAGMLLHESINSGQVRGPRGALAALIMVAGLGGSLLPVLGYIKIGLLFLAFYVVCLSCFQRPKDPLARAFSWTPLRWLGNMSYSYYLLHGLTLKALFMIVPAAFIAQNASMFFLLLPIFFILTLLPSAGLFLLVERPFSLLPQLSSMPVPPTTSSHSQGQWADPIDAYDEQRKTREFY
jgi:peptidoglycan/LPS O-acetylase OafA/YrhL